MDDEKFRFHIEVGRAAHEIAVRHGAWNGLSYAQRLAEEALASGQTDEHKFWTAVANSLRPR
jgi:hypothetical protein